MNVEILGQVGPQTVADGSNPTIRVERTGALVTTALHGRYFENTLRKNVFSASNQAAQAVSVALATTYTGLCLSNPIGSGVNLSLLKVNFALSVAPAAIASLHIIGGFAGATNVVHTAAVTPINNFLGGTNPAAKVDSQATIPTPAYLFSLCNGFTAAALPNQTLIPVDFEGSFVIPPGGFIAIGALTAVTGFGSFIWEEVPI
jgi:hypothetical protein